jgi:AcrR family transcriptional regulator
MNEAEDRRTRYTKQQIHEAFFDLLREKSFEKTTVTGICTRAEISRGTFYLHYVDKYELLDEVVDEALEADPPLGGEKPESLCQRAPVNADYRLLYTQPDLFSRVAQRVVEHGAEEMVPKIMEATGLPEDQARLLFVFTANGNLAVNRMLGWKRGPRFDQAQALIVRFVQHGYAGFEGENGRAPR